MKAIQPDYPALVQELGCPNQTFRVCGTQWMVSQQDSIPEFLPKCGIDEPVAGLDMGINRKR